MRAVVFFHGFLGTRNDWQPVIHSLGHSMECHTICLPGHSSELPGSFDISADYISEKIRLLFLKEKPFCVGYSLGGRLLLNTAKKYPDLMDGLILLSSHFGLKCEGERQDRISHDHWWAEKLRNGSFQEFLSEWYKQELFKSFVELPSFSDTILNKLGTHNPLFLADMLEATSLGRQEFLEDVLSFKNKALYVAGENDFKYFSMAEKLKTKAYKQSVCIIPNARHVVHLEAPNSVSAAVHNFLMRN